MQVNKLSGHPIFSQLLSYIPKDLVQKSVDKYQSDKYYKQLKTYQQLVFMLYGVICKPNSLTSLCKCLLFFENRLKCHGITHLPALSTLSDANINRKSEVFEDIYYSLIEFYKKDLFSNQTQGKINGEAPCEKLKRFDSTTITLFTDIFKGAGRLPLAGSKQGGIKAQALMSFNSVIPEYVQLGEAAKNDKDFLGQLKVKKDHLYVFDKGYVNYSVFQKWSNEDVQFVTRLNKNGSFKVISTTEGDYFDVVTGQGVIKDQTVEFKIKDSKDKFKARLVTYIDPESKKILTFLSNNFEYKPETIALIYKQRWQIEVYFKQVKQNFQLDYFYSDNPEGIKTQIWLVLIANLIFSVIHKQTKEHENYTTLVNMARQGLVSYVCLITIIKERKLNQNERNIEIVQLHLFEIEQGGVFQNKNKSP